VTLALLPQPDAREGRDRLEILAALISAPLFDPLFRGDIITIPAGHPVYRWNCSVADCRRSAAGHGALWLCRAHGQLWQQHRDNGGTRAGFLEAAVPFWTGGDAGEPPCRICPGRPASVLALRLCRYHQARWYDHRRRHDPDADFTLWTAEQEPQPGYGHCLVRVCPETAVSPLRLCYRHGRRYRLQGSPGGARIPGQRGSIERAGQPVAAACADEDAFRQWCSDAPAVLRPGQVNLRGLRPLLRAEIQWGMRRHGQGQHRHWELAVLQRIADHGRACGLSSLEEMNRDEDALRKAAGVKSPGIVGEITAGLEPLYVTPEDTREAGCIVFGHFGRTISGTGSSIDLGGVSQRWLRDLLWDHLARVLRSADCPRSAAPFRAMQRACLELGAFMELRAPGGGHDPRELTAEHMHQFTADLRQRELDGLPSLVTPGTRGGRPLTVTAAIRLSVFGAVRRLLRSTLESGEAGRLGLSRDFITAMPSAGAPVHRSRPPFPDEVARALAEEENLQRLARDCDPRDLGMRDAWETIIVTGRRCSEVLRLRLDCLGRYGGLPMLWHDQTKVGSYDEAVRIPERAFQMLAGRQDKTLAVFQARNNRPPTTGERAQMALFPSSHRNRDCRRALTYTWFHRGFKRWADDLDLGRWVPHQARHSMATSLLRAGASLSHIRRFLGHVSDRMAGHYIHLAHSDLEDVLQRVWVAGPGTASPGEPLTGDSSPLSREQAQALAIDLSRRSTPAEGGFCTFQPVVDGGSCPWNLDCHNCGKFVLSGADLLYWRRKREQWRLLAEGAPDDATADYLHAYFEPTARAIDGLEKTLAGLGLLDDALALDMRKPQDYFHRVWSTAFRASDLAAAGEEQDEETA
jgi:integrase